MLKLFTGRMYATLHHHESTQIFHPASLVMARISGLFVLPEHTANLASSFAGDWLEFIAEEEKTRAAWFCFISDIGMSPSVLLSKILTFREGNAAMFRYVR